MVLVKGTKFSKPTLNRAVSLDTILASRISRAQLSALNLPNNAQLKTQGVIALGALNINNSILTFHNFTFLCNVILGWDK